MSEVGPLDSTTDDSAQNNSDLSQHESGAERHRSSLLGRSAVEEAGDDLIMTEAEAKEEVNESPLARPDNEATVSWLKGEDLDQAKEPPKKPDLANTPADRRKLNILNILDRDTNDDPSKA